MVKPLTKQEIHDLALTAVKLSDPAPVLQSVASVYSLRNLEQHIASMRLDMHRRAEFNQLFPNGTELHYVQWLRKFDKKAFKWLVTE